MDDFNHRLILGLKNALIDGEKDVRLLTKKFSEYLMKNYDIKEKMDHQKRNYDNRIGSLRSEVGKLQTELENEKHANLNIKFQVEQLRALCNEKEQKLEELKNNSSKAAKLLSQKKERTKNGGRVKSSPSRLCSVTNNEDFLKCSRAMKIDDFEIKIQPLVSPTLSTFSSTPSPSEKLPTYSLICDENKTTISQSRPRGVEEFTAVNFNLQSSSNEDLHKNNNEIDFKDEIANEFEASTKNPDLDSKPKVNKTVVLDGALTVPNKMCDETLVSKPVRIDPVYEFVLEEKLNSLSKTTNCGIENSISKPKTEAVSYDDKNSKPKLTNIVSIFDPFEEETSRCAKRPLVNDEITNLISEKTCGNLLKSDGTKKVQYYHSEIKRNVNVSYPLFQKCDEEASCEMKIRCDNFSTTLEHTAISNKLRAASVETEKSVNETSTFAELSAAECIFVEERSVENTIEDVLLEMVKPLKLIEEIESLRKFYEEPLDAPKSGLEGSSKLNVTNEKETPIRNLSLSRQSLCGAGSKEDGSKSTLADVLSFLNEISKDYERTLEDQKLFEEFALSLKLESCRESTVAVDEPRENVTSPSYVVVLEITDSNYTANEQQRDVRDEIFNDWAVMDSLNEIDFKNVECEPRDYHALEYTSVPSPNSEDALRLEDTAGRICVQANDRFGNLLCWVDGSSDCDREIEKTQPESETFVAEDESTEREREKVETVVAVDEGSEEESEESELVIMEDEGVESESENVELVTTEIVETEEELKKTRLVDDENCNVQSEELQQSCNVDACSYIDSSVSTCSGRATHYNLRQKSTLCYVSLNKGLAYQRRATVNSGDFSPARKMSRSVVSSDNQEEISSALFECDPDSLDDDGTSRNKSCVPKFYVENHVETNQLYALPEKTHFEQVWSTIRNENVDDERTILSVEKSILVRCENTVIREAFEFNSNNSCKPITNKEEIINLNGVKRYIEDYLRKKEYQSLRPEAIANFLASVQISNQITVCCALEAVLLNSSKCVIEKQVNIPNDYVLICLEIDRMVFKGFVDAMKVHLKEKMFAKVFRINENSNGLNMISRTILRSSFYGILGKATGNVDDTINLLYESLMSMKNRAHPIAYGVLTQWPDVLKHRPRNALLIDIILFCYVHHKMSYNGDLYKLTEVKELIGQMYGVKLGEKTAEEYAKEAMMNIHREYWVDAIVLLCKRQMFSWTYTNVIMKYLVPLLNVWRIDVVKEALLLKVTQALRKILLSCPYQKERSNIYNFDVIVRTLSNILSNEEMNSRTLKENVYLAICELSPRSFSLCLEALSAWMPPDRKMSSDTLSQLNEMMNKEMNYHRWQTVIALQNPCKRLTQRKIKTPGYGESEKCNISKQKGIISVGVTRSSQIQARQAKTEVKVVKKKKKKKNKNGKKQKLGSV